VATVGVVRIHEVLVVVVSNENARAARAANLRPAGVDEAHEAIDAENNLSKLTVRKRHEDDYVLNPPESRRLELQRFEESVDGALWVGRDERGTRIVREAIAPHIDFFGCGSARRRCSCPPRPPS